MQKMTNIHMYKERELTNCPFIKSILMLLIVLYHSLLFWSGNWFTVLTPKQIIPFFNVVTIWLNSFHIYCFTIISGYLFYFVKYELGGYQSTGIFLKKKVFRLIIPYYVFAIFWAAPIGQVFFKWDWRTIVSRFVLGTNPSQLWFLLMIFGSLSILFFLSDIIKKNIVFGILISLICYSISFFGGHLIPNYFQVWTAFEYVPFVVIGFFLRQCNTSKLFNLPSVTWLIGNILFLFLSLQIETSNLFTKILFWGFDFLSHFFGAIWAFVFFQKLGTIIKWQEKPFLLFLSERSMTVFLVHQQIVYTVLYFFNDRMSPYMLGLVTFIIVLCVSLSIASLLKQFTITRVLIGEK